MRVLDAKGREKITPGFPVGAVIPFFGAFVPSGWAICDGTSGTPDLTDRFIVGDTVVSTGTASGTASPVAALTHAGLAVATHSDHVVGQANAHTNHTVNQPTTHVTHVVTNHGNHADHATGGAHTHDAHTTEAFTTGATGADASTVTHSSDGGHTHNSHTSHSGITVDSGAAHSAHAFTVDAHTVHTGAALDAHSAHTITQQSDHAVLKHYRLVMIVRQS